MHILYYLKSSDGEKAFLQQQKQMSELSAMGILSGKLQNGLED